MSDCVFCRILAGELPSKMVYRDDRVAAFNDIHPKAPTHVLVIPTRHVTRLSETKEDDREELGYLLERARHVAELLGVSRAFRLEVNNGEEAGQLVPHLHIHILSESQPKN
ncbi:MAG: histidine triad nucleotide-binding protein [bacterium]|nr:histidine triad nucleotide-binding protein [bacterium]